jgi:hypothetical protein
MVYDVVGWINMRLDKFKLSPDMNTVIGHRIQSVTGGEFRDNLNYCQLLKAELAPWSYLSVIYN